MGVLKSQMAAELAHQAPSEPPPSGQHVTVQSLMAGERGAHAALYDQLYPVIARTLQKILRSPSTDYEDLVQICFERIVRTLTSERGAEVENLNGWAGSIAAHVALDALRRRVRERRLFEHEPAGPRRVESIPAASLEQQLEARRQLEWLQSTLSRMKPDQAHTLLLHDVLGHDLREIAALMDVTVTAAQRRLWRGRQELLRRAKARAKGGT